jgi:FixJ family two-component response regulator
MSGSGIEHPADNQQIFILDDEAFVLETLRLILKDIGYDVICFTDEARLFKMMQGHSPKCIFLDLLLSGRSGLDVLEDLATYSAPVIAMSGVGDIQMAVNAVKGGAVDFIQKPFRREEILRILAEIPESASRRPPNRLSLDLPGKEPLSYRERQVVRHLVAGLSAKQSAEAFGLSHRTVEDHLARIKRKLGVKNLAELIAAVLKQS